MQSEKPSSAFAWYVVIVLTACYTLSFIDRQILGLLVGPIKKDLALSDTGIGLLTGLAFALFYTLLGLPLGRIADTKNRRNLIGISVLLWSFFSGMCSLARSFWSLVLTRVGVGFGEAGLSPAAYSMFSDMFPKERLGVVMSIYYMGVFLGQSLALLVGGTTVQAVSHMQSITLPILGTMAPWRITFLIAAAPGIPFALLVFTLREPMRRGLLQTGAGSGSKLNPRETLAQVAMRWQSVVGICGGMICQAICNYGFMAWTADVLPAHPPLDHRANRTRTRTHRGSLRLRRNADRRTSQRCLAEKGHARCAPADWRAIGDRDSSFSPWRFWRTMRVCRWR